MVMTLLAMRHSAPSRTRKNMSVNTSRPYGSRHRGVRDRSDVSAAT